MEIHKLLPHEHFEQLMGEMYVIFFEVCIKGDQFVCL